MKKIKYYIYLILLVPSFSLAALGDNAIVENTNSGSLGELLGSIQDWLLAIVGGLAVLFIIYGGFLYVTSSGNKQRIEIAKKTLTYAIGGLVIVVLAKLIFAVITGGFLTSIFGTKSL